MSLQWTLGQARDQRVSPKYAPEAADLASILEGANECLEAVFGGSDVPSTGEGRKTCARAVQSTKRFSMPQPASPLNLPLLRDLAHQAAVVTGLTVAALSAYVPARARRDLKWAAQGLAPGDDTSAAIAAAVVERIGDAVIERPEASAAALADQLQLDELAVRVAFLIIDHTPEAASMADEVDDPALAWWQPRAHDRLLAKLRAYHSEPPADVVEPEGTLRRLVGADLTYSPMGCAAGLTVDAAA